jgi:hypothetical protein
MAQDERITQAVADPAEFGFRWNIATLHHAGVARPNCPVVQVTDLSLFEDFVGSDKALAYINGQSAKVASQGVARNARTASPTATVDSIKEMVVENLLGITSRRAGQVVVYAFNGVTYDTEEEMMEAAEQHFSK